MNELIFLKKEDLPKAFLGKRPKKWQLNSLQ